MGGWCAIKRCAIYLQRELSHVLKIKRETIRIIQNHPPAMLVPSPSLPLVLGKFQTKRMGVDRHGALVHRGWRQEGHPAAKSLLDTLVYSRAASILIGISALSLHISTRRLLRWSLRVDLGTLVPLTIYSVVIINLEALRSWHTRCFTLLIMGH